MLWETTIRRGASIVAPWTMSSKNVRSSGSTPSLQGYQPREELEGHKSASSTAAGSGGTQKAQGGGQRGGARGRGRGGRWGRGGKARGGHQGQVNALDGNAPGGNQGSDTEPEPEN